MKKILAFGASSSSKSINRRLADYTSKQIEGVEVNLLDLNDFEMPIFSIDREEKGGVPDLANQFKSYIKNTDGIIISFAEHNSSFSAAYKNIFDWISRIEKDVWEQKPMFLMATSPGGRGGASVLEAASKAYHFANKSTIVEFSLPSFYDNFSEEEGIKNENLRMTFEGVLATFTQAVKEQ